MRIAILTSSRFGTAARCLPDLIRHPGVEVVLIVHAQAHFRSPWKRLTRDIRKVARIGLLGALNGIRMRAWGRAQGSPDLYALATEHGVPVALTPRTNAPETRELFAGAKADLGVSLGNGYIAPAVFNLPRFGMINLHTELLPEFRGAASVIWPIYEGNRETGFTIHQVSERIDEGAILYQERYPIIFRPTLADTVRATVHETARRIPPALASVIADYERLRSRATLQSGGREYTTPTFLQFLRMRRNNRRLWQDAHEHLRDDICARR